MNLLAPVSTIMTTDLVTVTEKEKIAVVKKIFDQHSFHHLPVIRDKELVGIISKTDLLFFMKGFSESSFDKIINKTRLNHYCAEVIMTKHLAKLEPTDRINVAVDVFLKNLFKALPVVEDNELVGLVTTMDIIKALAEQDSKISNGA